MKLETFIRSHLHSILQEWECFARTLTPGADSMDGLALRDHAEQMLLAITDDLAMSQSEPARYAKSRGEAAPSPIATAATVHGGLRFTSRFSIGQLAAEFRALRATVLRLWTNEGSAEAGEDLVRFNEAIDQVLAESIEAFAAKSNTTRDLFLGVLGHDLRGPLATMGLVGDILMAKRPTADESLEWGGSLKRATRHMAGMVDNLLNYTRLQLGGGAPQRNAMVDLASICNDAIVDARAAYPASEFQFTVSGDTRGLFDPVALRQLVTNLFVNAAQRGAQGDPIRADLNAQGRSIVFSVANRGRTIPAEDLATLFNPLVRAAGDDASHLGRTSLGLGLFFHTRPRPRMAATLPRSLRPAGLHGLSSRCPCVVRRNCPLPRGRLVKRTREPMQPGRANHNSGGDTTGDSHAATERTSAMPRCDPPHPTLIRKATSIQIEGRQTAPEMRSTCLGANWERFLRGQQ